MFTFNVRKLFRNTCAPGQAATPPRRKPRATFRPRLEVLEDRFCPATYNLWTAPQPQGGGSANWDVGTNWKLLHSPQPGETALFDPPAAGGSNTPCSIPVGDNLPTISGLLMNNYSGTLTLGSNLAADTVSINPRAKAGNEIIINSGSNLYALQSLAWAGGNVGGAGNFEVAGTATIKATNSADLPTLGTRMDVGTTFDNNYSSGTLTFSATSLPLVVVQNANIYVNNQSSLVIANEPLPGQTTATAISNGDTSAHSIIVNPFGTLDRTNVCELFVATGLDVEGGTVHVSNPQGQQSGNPLHFTRPTASGPGLVVNVYQSFVSIQGDLTSDYGGSFGGGRVTVFSGSTLTLGVNANSSPSSELGGEIDMEGKLVPHGGFTIYGGTFTTGATTTGVVKLDTGNEFNLVGGSLDITSTFGTGQAVGKLELQGDFYAYGGTIVDTVNSSKGTHGVFQVDGTATLYDYATFESYDLQSAGPNKTFNWNLMTVGGTRTGDFYYNLPPNWTPTWNGGTLTIQEKT